MYSIETNPPFSLPLLLCNDTPFRTRLREERLFFPLLLVQAPRKRGETGIKRRGRKWSKSFKKANGPFRGNYDGQARQRRGRIITFRCACSCDEASLSCSPVSKRATAVEYRFPVLIAAIEKNRAPLLYIYVCVCVRASGGPGKLAVLYVTRRNLRVVRRLFAAR